MSILLDYIMSVTVVEPTADANTDYLKQACVVVLPKSGQEGNVGTIYECTTSAQIAARTDNTEALQLLAAGLSRVYILLANDLDLSTPLSSDAADDFFTVLISSDFDKDDVVPDYAEGTVTITSYANLVSGTDDVVTINGVAFTAQAGAATLGEGTFQAATSNDATATSLAAQINAHADLDGVVTAEAAAAIVTITAVEQGSAGNALTLGYTDNDTNVGATKSGTTLAGGDGIFVGTFQGVVGISETDDDFLEDQAVIDNRVAFHTSAGTAAKNMMYAFGKLLSNLLNWKNQQYIDLPYADDITTLGAANVLFGKRISLCLSDAQFGNVLAFFGVGGDAIVKPYIERNLSVDMQSAFLQYVSGNQPQYTLTEAALIEKELQAVVDSYIERGWIADGVVEVSLIQNNFVIGGEINIAPPTALWKMVAEMKETL